MEFWNGNAQLLEAQLLYPIQTAEACSRYIQFTMAGAVLAPVESHLTLHLTREILQRGVHQERTQHGKLEGISLTVNVPCLTQRRPLTVERESTTILKRHCSISDRSTASVAKGRSPFESQGQIGLLPRARPQPSLHLRWSLGMEPDLRWHWLLAVSLLDRPEGTLGITP